MVNFEFPTPDSKFRVVGFFEIGDSSIEITSSRIFLLCFIRLRSLETFSMACRLGFPAVARAEEGRRCFPTSHLLKRMC
jgi:hypothetical protein